MRPRWRSRPLPSAWPLALGRSRSESGLPAIERLVTTALLKHGGRLYLEGTPAEACRYAFIQEPKLSAEGPRLVARFVFAGRAGVERGRSLRGSRSTTTLRVSGVPAFDAGDLYLASLKLDAPDSAYYKVVGGHAAGADREAAAAAVARDDRKIAWPKPAPPG